MISKTIGFRTVKMKMPRQNDGGEAFFFEVNDVPIFAKGANLVPLDVIPTSVTQGTHRQPLRVWARLGLGV
jgi:beta-mannosidase